LNDRKIPFAGYLDTMAEVDEMMGGVSRSAKTPIRDLTFDNCLVDSKHRHATCFREGRASRRFCIRSTA
jgi:hypothetical protein